MAIERYSFYKFNFHLRGYSLQRVETRAVVRAVAQSGVGCRALYAFCLVASSSFTTPNVCFTCKCMWRALSAR